jgi:rhodanese-related sulfurtransferase
MADAITREELKKLLGKEDVVIVDVRLPEYYAKEHIPGAINIPLEELDKNLDKLDKDKLVVVYCASFDCRLSPVAYRKLKRLGYQVVDYEGGMMDWKEKYPVESAEFADAAEAGELGGKDE